LVINPAVYSQLSRSTDNVTSFIIINLSDQEKNTLENEPKLEINRRCTLFREGYTLIEFTTNVFYLDIYLVHKADHL